MGEQPNHGRGETEIHPLQNGIQTELMEIPSNRMVEPNARDTQIPEILPKIPEWPEGVDLGLLSYKVIVLLLLLQQNYE